ncbi:transcriptional regulator [Clostridium botulinum]|uniref:Aminopyrimidine aminohydrolase n=1 Tax=Clostridium botulinum TaxID=1491 RepID=A0A9Q1UZY6_CLOBO|nr:thiaminase II [Clostridium botulinum]AEB75278.1 transcriptional activator, TenA [Clostridium botulinum BKT015925]KEI03236.1 transcriptional regulator [Clostridium botulinum C/D str. Sp77]KOA80629.1 transcriptional regulator [Clostridium botulinum]KOA82545.1 transcriptional regulator [Clostridium botulinum]KOA87296.1 transcriptional regulator [Clostridium botulinum]
MEFTEYLFQEVKEIWHGYLKHPFVREMGEGILPKEKFRDYLIQDYLYLKEYSKVFCIGVVKSTTMKDMKFFYRSIEGTMEDETQTHIKYLEDFGFETTEVEKMMPNLVNVSYTGYMQGQALTGDLKQVAVATLACTWSYDYIGKYLWKTYKDNLENNFYREWIESYSSESGDKFAKDWINYVDDLCENISQDEKKKLTTIFVNCSKYEMQFWDMAYKK